MSNTTCTDPKQLSASLKELIDQKVTKVEKLPSLLKQANMISDIKENTVGQAVISQREAAIGVPPIRVPNPTKVILGDMVDGEFEYNPLHNINQGTFRIGELVSKAETFPFRINQPPKQVLKTAVVKNNPEGIILIHSTDKDSDNKYFNVDVELTYNEENLKSVSESALKRIKKLKGDDVIVQKSVFPPIFCKANMVDMPENFPCDDFIKIKRADIALLQRKYEIYYKEFTHEVGLVFSFNKIDNTITWYGCCLRNKVVIPNTYEGDLYFLLFDYIDEFESNKEKFFSDETYGCIKLNNESSEKEEMKENVEESAHTDENIEDTKYIHLPEICKDIREWLKTGGPKKLHTYMQDRVKGQPEITMFVANVVNYLQQVSIGNTHHNNMLLAAPSGCGKTETYRALRDYFKAEFNEQLPIYQYDMTSMTANGFKGEDSKAMLGQLFTRHKTRGIGIVFLDEFDKKLQPRYTYYGDNTNQEVQSQILVMIEGKEIPVESGSIVNTANTLFVGLGSYDEFRKSKENDDAHVGFIHNEKDEYDHYTPITKENMIELGASYELLGRMGSVINYQKLSEDIVREIIAGMIQKETEGVGFEVVIEEPMIRYLIDNANSNYGCRRLTEIIHEHVIRVYANLMLSDDEIANARIVLRDNGDAFFEKIEETVTDGDNEAEFEA